MNELLAQLLNLPVPRVTAGMDPAFFTTPIPPEMASDFAAWKQRYAPLDSGYDYDLPGAFLAGITPDPASGHFPDTFKKPNHPTFSNESQYARFRPDLAGRWTGEQFHPATIGSLLQLLGQ